MEDDLVAHRTREARSGTQQPVGPLHVLSVVPDVAATANLCFVHNEEMSGGIERTAFNQEVIKLARPELWGRIELVILGTEPTRANHSSM